MLPCLRIVTHFMMRRVIGIHVLQFTMRTGADPVTNASGVGLRARRDEAPLVMVAVLRSESAGRREADRRKCAQTCERAQKCFSLEHVSLSPVYVDCVAVCDSIDNATSD